MRVQLLKSEYGLFQNMSDQVQNRLVLELLSSFLMCPDVEVAEEQMFRFGCDCAILMPSFHLLEEKLILNYCT